MAQVTLDQRKLEELKQQLFGKPEQNRSTKSKNPKPQLDKFTLPNSTVVQNLVNPQLASQDLSYLKRDLSKILILTVIALVFQFGLFLAINTHIIKLPI